MSGDDVEEDAVALLGVASGAVEAVEEDAGALAEVASGAGGTVEEDAGALEGVAAGAGGAVEEDAGALVEEAVVITTVDCKSGIEMTREKERGIRRVASLGNRLDGSTSFQTARLHGENLLFGVGQQNEWCGVRPVCSAISADFGGAATAGWQASDEPRDKRADGYGADDHIKGGRAGIRGSEPVTEVETEEQMTESLVEGVFEAGVEVEIVEQTKEALVEGMPESCAEVKTEEQTKETLGEGMPESGAEVETEE